MCKQTRDNYTIEYPTLMNRYSNMIERCYNPEYHLYPYYGALGVAVCDYWRDPDQGYKRYVNWILSQKTVEEMQGLQIDKDRLSAKLGIKPAMYSPETCCILTAAENAQSRKLLKSTNTTGYKGIAPAKGTKWQATCVLNGVSKHLGCWDTKLQAAKAYDYYNILVNSFSTLNGVLEDGETVPGITVEGYYNPNYSSSNYGVTYDKNRGKWSAQVYFEKKRNALGRFATEQEAAQAVKEFCITNNHNIHKLTKEP
jgi:hypothetical protein